LEGTGLVDPARHPAPALATPVADIGALSLGKQIARSGERRSLEAGRSVEARGRSTQTDRSLRADQSRRTDHSMHLT
jgi:hypothetical protein